MRKSVLIISALTVLVWFSFGPGALPVRAAGLFDDVPANHWAVEAIREMQSRGIIGGFPEDNTFRGNEPLNRYQMVVLVKKLISSLESRESTSVQQVDLVRSLLLEFADDMKFLGESSLYHMERLRSVESRLDSIEKRLDRQDNLLQDLKRKQKRQLLMSVLLTAAAAVAVK